MTALTKGQDRALVHLYRDSNQLPWGHVSAQPNVDEGFAIKFYGDFSGIQACYTDEEFQQINTAVETNQPSLTTFAVNKSLVNKLLEADDILFAANNALKHFRDHPRLVKERQSVESLYQTLMNLPGNVHDGMSSELNPHGKYLGTEGQVEVPPGGIIVQLPYKAETIAKIHALESKIAGTRHFIDQPEHFYTSAVRDANNHFQKQGGIFAAAIVQKMTPKHNIPEPAYVSPDTIPDEVFFGQDKPLA